jgi:hypothetical protein
MALADLASVILGLSENDHRGIFTLDVKPALSHTFMDSENTQTAVIATYKLNDFIENCKKFRGGEFGTHVTSFCDSGGALDLRAVATRTLRNAKQGYSHTGVLRYPRPRGRAPAGTVWNFWTDKWVQSTRLEVRIRNFYRIRKVSERYPGSLNPVSPEHPQSLCNCQSSVLRVTLQTFSPCYCCRTANVGLLQHNVRGWSTIGRGRRFCKR